MTIEFRNQLAVCGRGHKDSGIQIHLRCPPLPKSHTHYEPVPIWGSSVVMESPSLTTRDGVRKREEICCTSQASQDLWGALEKGDLSLLYFHTWRDNRDILFLSFTLYFQKEVSRNRSMQKLKNQIQYRTKCPKAAGESLYVHCSILGSPRPLELSIV